MYRLLLDSSDKDLNVGIALDDKLVYSYSTYAWQRQSEYMIPEIDKALKSLNITLKDIDEVVLGIGPGSYTGVRIPLTIAKTLNTTCKTKVVPLSSLQILGRSDENYIALINARSNRSYIGVYSQGKCLVPDQVVENSKIPELVQKYLDQGFAYKGDVEYLSLAKTNFDVINGLLTNALLAKPIEDAKGLKPVYLKD